MRLSTRRHSTSLAREERTLPRWIFWSTWLWCLLRILSISRSQVPFRREMITTTLWRFLSVFYGSGLMLMLLSGSPTTFQWLSLDQSLVSFQLSFTQSVYLSEMWRSFRTSKLLSRYSRVSSLTKKSPWQNLTPPRSSRWQDVQVSLGFFSRWQQAKRLSSTTTQFSTKCQSSSSLSSKSTQLSWETGSRRAMIYSKPTAIAMCSLC